MKNSRALTAVLRPASGTLHAATLDLEILCGIKDEFLAGGLRPVVQALILLICEDQILKSPFFEKVILRTNI